MLTGAKKTTFPVFVLICVISFLLLSSFYNHKKQPTGVTLLKRIPSALKTYQLAQCSDSDRVKSYVMVKIGKTGTSTLIFMLARFMNTEGLSILRPSVGLFINWLKPRQQGFQISPPEVKKADVLINHAIYRPDILKEKMVSGYKLIVPTREPVSWFKSAAAYYQKFAHTESGDPNVVINTPELFYKVRHDGTGLQKWFHLVQLQWLGFDYRARDNITAIEEFIVQLVPRIDVIMLTDQFDASLVILKKKFCWNFTDIFYWSGNVKHSARLEFTEDNAKKVLDLNHGDKLLYDTLKEIWYKQPEVKAPDFWDEVRYFQTLNKNATERCKEVLKSRTTFTIKSNQWHDDIPLTYKYCSRFLCRKYCNSLFSADPGQFSESPKFIK